LTAAAPIAPPERDGNEPAPRPRRRRGVYRDLAAAFSLANLCYVKLWTGLLAFTESEAFFMKSAPANKAIGAGLLNTTALAVALWLAMRAARARRPVFVARAGAAVILAAFFVFANGVRETLSTFLPLPFLRFRMVAMLGRGGTVAFLLAFLFGVTIAAYLQSRRMAAVAMPFLYASFVFVPTTFGYAAWSLVRDRSAAFREAPAASRLGPRPDRRAVWIVFDEWDQRLTFDDRPRGLELPEIDRFRAAAVYANHALPPAGETALSITSLLSGRTVRDARPVAPNALRITFADSGESTTWGREPNVLSETRAWGRNVAVIGWYLPYCRVFASVLTACDWIELPVQSNSLGETFGEALPNQFRSLFETNLLSPFGQSLAVRRHARRYQDAVERAAAAAADSDMALTLIHLPAAHVPYFYDRRTQRPYAANSLVAGYVNGLALADWTLGRIRERMEHENVWDSSTVLLTSDHWFRQSELFDGKTDHRVPFLVKLAGQHGATSYDRAFNTTLSAELVSAALTGRLTVSDDLGAWIGRHSR